MFNSGTLVVPNQAEGNPFYTMVEDVQRDEDGGIIKMKLDKARILEAESKLNNLLGDLIAINQITKNKDNFSPTQLLRII